MYDVIAGPELEEFCAWSYHADVPFLLLGKHGVGKSQSLRAVATQLGIQLITLNLAALEATDLLGMPIVVQDHVEYAPPQWFPTEGRGLLFLDEISRAPRHLRAPLYQLLTERAINGRRLGAGWLPVAAANTGTAYDVDELDPAFVSRFVRVTVKVTVESWLLWARGAAVHERVLDFATVHPDLFENSESNPRAWERVSHLLHAGDREHLDRPPEHRTSIPLLQKMIAGLVGDAWAASFWQHYIGTGRPIEPTAIIADYTVQRPRVQQWVSQKRLDLLHQTLKLLQGHLQSQAIHDAVVAVERQRLGVIAFVQDLPAELSRKWSDWVVDREFDQLALPKKGSRKKRSRS